MIPNFHFHSINVFSNETNKEKLVFTWEFKEINFLIGKNNTGKTTFFHLMKDILGNPNPAGKNTSGKYIFLQDLLLKNLKVKLKFSIGKSTFTTEKTYAPTVNQNFYNELGENIGGIERFLSYLIEKNIIGLPKVIYKDKSKITLYSIMRLCFIGQNHFGEKSKPEKGKWSNMIIKHNNDGRTMILFYAYVLGILEDENILTGYYADLLFLSETENRLKHIRKQINLITNSREIDLENNLFSDAEILKNIQDFQKNKRKLTMNLYNYNDILSNMLELYQFNKKTEDSNMIYYITLIEKDLKLIKQKVNVTKEEIKKINSKINTEKGKLDSIDDFLIEHHLYKLESLSGDTQDMYKTLIKEKEIENIKFREQLQKYSTIKEYIVSSNKADLFFTMVKEVNKFLGEINLEILIESGKYKVSTSADSINRIILFNILLSFVVLKDKLKINHPGFIFFDSPFVGLDNDKELLAIKNFIDSFDNYATSGQFFLSLNPEELDINTILSDHNLVSVKQIEEKLFNFS